MTAALSGAARHAPGARGGDVRGPARVVEGAAGRAPVRDRASVVKERLVIDWVACDGRGLCTELLPELLGEDDWGFPLSRSGEPSPEVPPSLHDHAARAVRECPMLALKLTRSR